MSVVQCAEGNTQLRDEAALLINTGVSRAFLGGLLIPGVLGIGRKLTLAVVWGW